MLLTVESSEKEREFSATSWSILTRKEGSKAISKKKLKKLGWGELSSTLLCANNLI